MASLVPVYFLLIGSRVRAQMQYRWSFVLHMIGSALLSFVEFLGVLVIFRHLPALGGWTLGEVAFLYGTSYVPFRLTDMAFGHLDQLPQAIQRGEFDQVLVRPLGSLFQVVTSDFQVRHLGSTAQGAFVFALSLSMVEIDWTAGRVLMLAALPFSGVAIFASIWVIGAASTFWTVRTIEILNSFTYGGNQLTSYPLNIYDRWLRRLFAFVVPLAFINYFPALYLLDKDDPLGLPPIWRFLSPVVAVAMVLLARFVWGVGVRHYRSTGS